jgi:hypothetical protein
MQSGPDAAADAGEAVPMVAAVASMSDARDNTVQTGS